MRVKHRALDYFTISIKHWFDIIINSYREKNGLFARDKTDFGSSVKLFVSVNLVIVQNYKLYVQTILNQFRTLFFSF